MAFTEHVSKSYVDGKLAQKASAESLNAEVAARESLSSRVEEHVRDTYPKAVVDEKIAAAKPSDYETLKGRVSEVEGKIPSQASSSNQLADKAFVNSSIATNTAFYISDNGKPFHSLADLENYEGALTNNDYAFVVGTDSEGNTTYTRYKWSEATETWGEEYVLNNSSFTAAQWAAINSGITSGDVTKLGGIAAGAQVNVIETVKVNGTALTPQDKAVNIPVPTFDNAVTKDSANGVKSSGIWSAIWGALSALPAGFSSLYDWCVSQLAGKASKADAMLTERGLSAWVWEGTPPTYEGKKVVLRLEDYPFALDDMGKCWVAYTVDGEQCGPNGDPVARDDDNTKTTVTVQVGGSGYHTATRTALPGYCLGPDAQTNPNRDKPLASEAEAEALRQGKADRAANPTAGNLAALDAQGNPTDSLIPAANVATKGEIRYDRITITTGQLQDHAVQKVTLNAATTTLSLPALTDLTGKVSDFGIDMVNGYAPSDTPTAASFSLAGTIGTDYNIIVPEGEDLSEISTLAAGEMAVYYFTLSAFAINDKPTWEVTKKVVTLVPVPPAP